MNEAAVHQNTKTKSSRGEGRGRASSCGGGRSAARMCVGNTHISWGWTWPPLRIERASWKKIILGLVMILKQWEVVYNAMVRSELEEDWSPCNCCPEKVVALRSNYPCLKQCLQQEIGTLSKSTLNQCPYLIFVISFTQAAFSNSKFYTGKLTKNTSKHWKMSLKSKIYAVFVFNLENFTPDRIFLHGHRPWCP